MNYKKKNYDNSYLFMLEADKHHRALTEFILKSDRIEKNSDAFRGIIEDVKRMQNSSVLHTVLMRDDVVLCIAKGQGLPRAFKVFEAKDIRMDQQPKVFIDITGIVEFKNGYFTCKKIDWLINYIFNAMAYLIYSHNPIKLISNSNISIAGTECFVSMFTYIIDYLRIIGFAQNKEKISYLAGLYFLNHMMGKDLDMYSKNIAAKVAGLTQMEVRNYDLYYDIEDFNNIDSFITMISETFKLKGFNTETFIHRWNYSFGDGTYYATELLTSFMCLIISAFCSSYIVNQKQVERCCGASEVKFCNALLQIGNDEFDHRGYMESSEFENTLPKDKATEALRESFLKRNKLPDNCKTKPEDFASKSKIKTICDANIKYYKECNKEDKISNAIKIIFFAALGAMGQYNANGTENVYEIGVAETILKSGRKYLNAKDINIISRELKVAVDTFPSYIQKLRDTDKEKAQRFAKTLVELRKCYSMM